MAAAPAGSIGIMQFTQQMDQSITDIYLVNNKIFIGVLMVTLI